MQTKRFSGDTIDQVLTQVRGELGDDAVIQTRRIVRGGIGGFFGKAGIEVTAADVMPDAGSAGDEAPPPAEPPPADADDFLARLRRHLSQTGSAGVDGEVKDADEQESQAQVDPEEMRSAGVYTRAAVAQMPADEQDRARAIVEAARAAVREVAGEADPAAGSSAQAQVDADPTPRASAAEAPAADDAVATADDPRPGAREVPARAGLDDVRRELAAAGVEARRLDSLLDGFSRSIVPFLDPEASTRDAVRDYLAARLPVVRDWRPRRQGHTIAFVGQSGVGKTSVAAKVAGRHLQAGLDVALIGAGPGANAPLDDLARRLGVPVVHAEDAEALGEARRTLVDRDLVIIDTPGCAHTAADDLAVLRTLLGGANPDEVHLVLPASTQPIDLGDLHTAFRPVGVNRITLTKLDETRHFGGVLNAPMRIGRPLAYIADGASVPAAIAPADPRLAAELLLP